MTPIITSWDSLVEYFWKRVDKKAPNECWNYNGNRDTDGYGRIEAKSLGITIRATRLSWIIHFGKIKPSEFACHKCDNPPCVNPNHLFLGSNSDNFKDMWRKGRGRIAVGEQHSGVKLNNQKVLTVRRLWEKGTKDTMRLARKYNVTQSNIHCIVHRKSWTHI